MKRHLLLLLAAATLASVSCSRSDENPTPGTDEGDTPSESVDPSLPESKCIVAGYSMYTRIYNAASEQQYAYLRYPTRVHCFSVAPDAEGKWFVYNSVTESFARARKVMRPEQEVFLVVGGGAEAANMHTMGTDPAKRAAYLEAAVAYAHAHDFDGISLDWETDWKASPVKYVQRDDLVALLTELRGCMSRLPADTRLRYLTVAVSPIRQAWEIAGAIVELVDQLDVMVYDTYGTAAENYAHAPMRIVKEVLDAYERNGVPRDKMVLGVPFYGSDRRPSAASSELREYRALVAAAKGAITASSNFFDGVAFNGVDLIREKARYVLDNGYAGIMVWELSYDVDYDDPLSLLRAIRNVTDK